MSSTMVVPEINCIPKPSHFTDAEASGFFAGFTTAYHGLIQRGKLKKGEVLLVTGAAGGMGSIAIQLGKRIGATIIAAASSDDKLSVAAKLGAHHLINYSQKSLNEEVKKITKGKGADVVYELVGGEIFDQCTRITAPEGRLLVVGFAGGSIPKIPANLPLIKGYSVVGVRAGQSFRDRPELLKEIHEDVKKWGATLEPPVVHNPIFDARSLDSIKEAYHTLAQRRAIGKIVVSWNSVQSSARL